LKVKVTEVKSWQRVVEIEVPAEKVQEEFDRAYREYQRKAVLPGFRKGKAPISLLKAKYSEAVERTVLEEYIPRAWEEARQQNHINPIAEPAISDVVFAPGQPLKFKASVEVRPEIPPIDYAVFRATRREVKVSPEDVDRNLRALQEHHAVIEPSQDTVGESDIVMVDSWKVDQNGIPIVGHKYSDILIDLSAPNVIKEYKSMLVGAAVGDQKRVTVTYPPDHPKKELAGQTVSFLLKVKETKKKILPILDDEFAKSISEYPTLEALKEGLYKNLQEKEEHRARRDVEEQIIDQIIEQNHFEVPESMVAGYVEALISDLHPGEKSADEQDQLRRSYRPLAVRTVKRWFILEEVRQREALKVGDQELEIRVKAMAEAHHADPEEIQQHLAQSNELERLRRDLEEEKTLGFLVGKAEVTSRPAEIE